MERIQGFSRILASGAPAPACTVTVYYGGTVVVASIYADDLEVPTPKANPFVADSAGYWFFYGTNGTYDIVLSGGGIVAPYTLAGVPAGVGAAGAAGILHGDLPVPVGIEHNGRLLNVLNVQKGLWMQTLDGVLPVLDNPISSAALAALPAAGQAGRIRRVTDNKQGLYVDDGAAWTPALAYALESHAQGAFPAAGLAGRLRRMSNSIGGVWLDTGTAWRALVPTVHVQDFGADPSGVADSTAAIQAAIDAAAAAASSALLVFQPGSYKVTAPILVRSGIQLLGQGGTTLVMGAGFAGDSMIRAYRRDDNVLLNIDEIHVSDIRFSVSAAVPAGFSAIDLTGTGQASLNNVAVVGTGSGVANAPTVLRLADRNPAGTSSKYCINARIYGLTALGLTTMTKLADTGTGNNYGHTFIGVVGELVRIGLDVSGMAAGSAPGITFIGLNLYGDGNAASKVVDLGANPWPRNISFIQAVNTNFVDHAELRANNFFTSGLTVGTSGTIATSALVPGGTLASNFAGSAMVKIPSGTALVAGINAYTYTFPGVPLTGSWTCICHQGTPAVPFSLQATNAGTTLTLRVVVTAPITLTEDLVVHVIQNVLSGATS